MDSRDHAGRTRWIVVTGPLAPFADGLRQDLARQGYALDTVTEHVHLLADLSGWLAGRGLAAADLTEEVAGEFLVARRAAGHRTGVSGRALAPGLGYLRRVQAVPPPVQPVPATPLEVLLASYRQYLEAERGLSAGTVRHYQRYARAFLAGLGGPLSRPGRAVRRAGHWLCPGAGQAPAGQGTGHGDATRAAIAAALPARGRAYAAAAGRGGPGRAGLEAGPAARRLRGSSAGGPGRLRPRERRRPP